MRSRELEPRISINNGGLHLRSIDERNGHHCLAELGEPIPSVDPAAYFNSLKTHGVDQFMALKHTIGGYEKINNKELPISERRSIAEAMSAAIEALPPRHQRLVPVGQTQVVYSGRK